jgi:fumarate reductase subunit C
MKRDQTLSEFFKSFGFAFIRYLKSALVIFIAIFLCFLISYHYTYFELTPEYSGVEFKRTRIGPISVELPASFNTTW